jgi:RNA polymerase sigma-70 factor (ECF subfamily)
LSDAELVARLKNREDEAYREVLERNSDPLYAYIYGITGDMQLSQDILGETFLRMVERIDTYVYQGAPFKAWLYRIAHNLAINALKHARFTVNTPDLERIARPITDPAIRISARLEAEELRLILRAVLLELTEEQQQVIALRFVSGQSLAETAKMLGKTENAVKQMQLRALRALERLIERRTRYDG